MKKIIYLFIVIGGWMLNQCVQANDIILIADPKILAVPIVENHEPMMELKQQTEIAYGPSPEIPNNTDYTQVREIIYEKLIQAQKLLPKGLHFCLYEGYRSLTLQKMLFDNRFAAVKRHHPNWAQEQLFKETIKLVSPVTNFDGSPNVPPHSTGGAIDVYLIDDQGKAIDMGMHPKDWVDDNDGSLSLTDSKIISTEAQKNRKIMRDALTQVGFVNYPTEYWHWSYGDRYWAYFKKEKHAIYASYLHP